MKWREIKLKEHKGFLGSALVAIFIVSSGFFVAHREKIALSNNNRDAETQVAAVGSKTDRDSDGDGLFDWEEKLYGADMYKTDSDQDGTTDGEEVRARRDPAKAGPNDALPTLPIPNLATSTKDLNALKKEFYTAYLTKEGDRIKEATFRDLVDQFDPKEFTPRFNLVDLKVSSDNSPEALRTYANTFGAIIDKYTRGNSPNETDILQAALTKKDERLLQELQLPVIEYRNFANDLKNMQVPSGLAKDHLLIVNGYDVIARSLFALIGLFRDPIRGGGAYEAYLAHIYLVTDGYAGVVNYLHTKAVEFNEKERGYYFRWRGNTLNIATTTARRTP